MIRQAKCIDAKDLPEQLQGLLIEGNLYTVEVCKSSPNLVYVNELKDFTFTSRFEIEEPKASGLTTAVKHDTNKPRLDLLSVPALNATAQVMTYGALKYAPHNWRKGFDWSRLYAAALRHLLAHMSGEDKDPETGLSHLSHAACCIMFLQEHEIKGLGNDDRHKG